MLDIAEDVAVETSVLCTENPIKSLSGISREVYLLNDDYTPMEFVSDVLMRVFNMDARRSERTVVGAHYNGKASCGSFPKDLAETLACAAIDIGRKAGYPLMLITAKPNL